MQNRRLTDLRLKRLMLWVRLWCELIRRLLGEQVLEQHLAPLLRERLKFMRAWTLRLIFISAARRAPSKLVIRHSHRWHGYQPPSGALRIILGAKLRRAARGRGFLGQLNALIDLLTNPEDAIAGLAKRLARGMRRRRSFGFDDLIALANMRAPAPALANTS